MNNGFNDLQLAKNIQAQWLKSRFKLTHVFEHHNQVTLAERFMEPVTNLREYMAWSYTKNLPIYQCAHTEAESSECFDRGLNTFFTALTQDFNHYAIMRSGRVNKLVVNARTLEPNIIYTKEVKRVLTDLKHAYNIFQAFHCNTYHYKLFERHRCIRVDQQYVMDDNANAFSVHAYVWQPRSEPWKSVHAY